MQSYLTVNVILLYPHKLNYLSVLPTFSQADTYTQEELTDIFKQFSITAPVTGNPLSPPMEFNLMFKTTIGPGGGITGSVSPL